MDVNNVFAFRLALENRPVPMPSRWHHFIPVRFGNGDDRAVQPSIGKQLVGERGDFPGAGFLATGEILGHGSVSRCKSLAVPGAETGTIRLCP